MCHNQLTLCAMRAAERRCLARFGSLDKANEATQLSKRSSAASTEAHRQRLRGGSGGSRPASVQSLQHALLLHGALVLNAALQAARHDMMTLDAKEPSHRSGVEFPHLRLEQTRTLRGLSPVGATLDDSAKLAAKRSKRYPRDSAASIAAVCKQRRSVNLGVQSSALLSLQRQPWLPS
jgi:hypothetical protein